MHEFVSLNGQITTATDAAIPAISPASFYGRGVFTTIAIYDGKPFLWNKHWARLMNNAAALGIDISEISEATISHSLSEIIAKNGVLEGRTRITIFDTGSGGLWSIKSSQKTTLLITTDDQRTVTNDLSLMVSPFLTNSKSPLTGIKSCNYLENLLALERAREHGCDEAIRLNERGEIVSGCMANVFWQRGNEFFTPSLKTGCLLGTTREYLLEKLQCSEVEQNLEAIRDADAIFLTSAGLGIAEVWEFDGRKLARANKITNLLPKNKSQSHEN